jgi:hypothetical protein
MTTIPRRVLVVSVSDDRDTVTSAMSHWAIDPIYCTSVSEARELLPNVRPCVIFCEETLADGTYRELDRDPCDAGPSAALRRAGEIRSFLPRALDPIPS